MILLKNQTGALEDMSSLFKHAGINIAQLIQKERTKSNAELVVVTDAAKESDFNQLKKDLTQSDVIDSINSMIRVGL